MEPIERQHPAITKVNLDVTKLSEITMDALSTWFADKENPANAAKQPLLKELFKLALAEERYKNGEIGEWSNPTQHVDRIAILTTCHLQIGLRSSL